jgi:hypothetical protein
MAKEEVEENVAELGRLALKLSTGKNRTKFLSLVSEDNPDLPIPEIQSRREIQEATAPLLQKISTLETKLGNDDAAKRLEERRKPVAHLSADALKKLEQFMIDKGVSDYGIAQREMERLDQVAAPRDPGRFGRAEMPTADKEGLLYKDPAKYRTNTLHSLIDDLKAGKRI